MIERDPGFLNDGKSPPYISDLPVHHILVDGDNGKIRLACYSADDLAVLVISGDDEDGKVISGIAGKPDFTVISIYKNMMNREIGYVRRALTVIEEAGIPFDHIPTGIDSLSMVIETSALEDKLNDVLDELKLRLKPDEISVEDNIALIAVVGRKMSRTPGVAARICSALAQNGINIRMLNQGTSEINIIVGVEAKDFEKAVNIIYSEFMA